MSFWSGLLNIATGGLSQLFRGGSDSLEKFTSDPLGYGSKALSDELAQKQYELSERQFKQGQENWQKEFDLQNDQFNYQKWYDQNNVSLQMQQNAKYGINPIVANGSPTSTAVSASASPQSPSSGSSPLPSGGAPILDLLGTLIGAKVSKDRADQQARLQQQALNNEKNYQSGLLTVLGKRADNETSRTTDYGRHIDATNDEIRARIRDLEYELKYRQDRGISHDTTDEFKNVYEGVHVAKKAYEKGKEYVDSHKKPAKVSESPAQKEAEWNAFKIDRDIYERKYGSVLTFEAWKKGVRP